MLHNGSTRICPGYKPAYYSFAAVIAAKSASAFFHSTKSPSSFFA
jgi:hypothetical protein